MKQSYDYLFDNKEYKGYYYNAELAAVRKS